MEYETVKKRKSKAKKIRNLFLKQKKLIGSSRKIINHTEPILILHRRGGNAEFFEGATGDRFFFKHSSGKERYIDLIPSKIETMDYFGHKMRFYDCHEDRPYPGWENPIVDSESVALSHEKTRSSIEKYQASLIRAKAQLKGAWVKWVIGIAIAIAIILFAIGQWAPQLLNPPAPAVPSPPAVGGLILLFLQKKNLNRLNSLI